MDQKEFEKKRKEFDSLLRSQGDYEPDNTLTSKCLATIIVDALVRAKLVNEEVFDKALWVAAEEIEICKITKSY